MAEFDRRSAARIARETRRAEQEQTPRYRPRARRQKPNPPKGDSLICAKHTAELPKATFNKDPAKVVVKAVEVEIFRLIPKDDKTESGKPGDYKLEAIKNGNDPAKEVVANFSFTDAIPKDEWFWVLPSNGPIKIATIWSC